jgi:hypothetical protein
VKYRRKSMAADIYLKVLSLIKEEEEEEEEEY